MKRSELRDAVTRGVAVLDEKFPDWFLADRSRPIDLKTLSMDSNRRCILGQLFGDFTDGRERLNLYGETWGIRSGWGRQSVRYGFDVQWENRSIWGEVVRVPQEYRMLRRMWTRIIKQRRATVKTVTTV